MLNKPILSTKLNRPRCFQTYFERIRLVKLLEANKTKVATFIIGGAGYGKSTLVSQWVKNKTSIWVSCDADMNNVESFLSYIVYAFIKNNLNSFPQTSILLSGQNTINKELLVNTFFTEINTTTKQTYVVLDDFHLVNNPQITKLLELYLKHPPKNIHLIIITRHDPVFNFSKHRLNNVFHEIRMRDLNLTNAELKDYAKACFDLDLNKQQLAILMDKTEGWFLGVTQLLSASKELQIPMHPDRNALQLERFNTYFSEEVIQRQSENHRMVLFVSSLFHQFSKGLIESVLTKIDPQFPMSEISGALMNKNNFTISLDYTYFRFHHQFHEALGRFFENHAYDRHRKNCLEIGGEWLIEHHLYEDGIQALLDSGNVALAIKHLSCFRYDMLNADQYTRLAHVLSMFPVEMQQTNIELLLINAIILEYQGKFEVLTEVLQACEEAASKGLLSDQQLGECILWKGLLSYFSGDYQESLSFVEKSLSLMSTHATSLITFAIAFKVLALNACHKKEEALEFLNNKLDFLHHSEQKSIVRILVSKALIYSLHSELLKRKPFISQIIEISEQFNYFETLGMGLYLQVETNYRTGNFESCEDFFNRAHDNRYLMRPFWYANILAIKIYCGLRQNDQWLKEGIRQLKEFAKDQNAENINQFKNAIMCEVALHQGNYDEASHLNQLSKSHNYPPFIYYYLTQITELKALLFTAETGNIEAFVQTSIPLWKFAADHEHPNLLLKLNILNAIAYYMQSDTKNATKYMKAALLISERTGDVFVFKEFSDHVYDILVDMNKQDNAMPHLQHILSFFEVATSSNKAELFELKERDVKILKLVSSGHTNAQIAEKMFLSPESVKKYLYDIFQILEVKNRINAVLKAREIGILKSQRL